MSGGRGLIVKIGMEGRDFLKYMDALFPHVLSACANPAEATLVSGPLLSLSPQFFPFFSFHFLSSLSSSFSFSFWSVITPSVLLTNRNCLV